MPPFRPVGFHFAGRRAAAGARGGSGCKPRTAGRCLFVTPFLSSAPPRLEEKACSRPVSFRFSLRIPAALQGASRFFAARNEFLSAKTEISCRKETAFWAGKCAYGAVPRPRFLTFGPLVRGFFVLRVLRIPPDSGLRVVFWGASVPKCQPAFTVSFSSLSGISVHGRPDR